MKTDLAASTTRQQNHLFARIQFVALAIVLAQASIVSAATFVKGTYNGLFSEMDDTNAVVTSVSSGFLTLSVRESGTFSGKLSISDGTSPSGAKYPLSGEFDADGQKTLIISRKAAAGGSLIVQLQYAPAGQTDTVTGSVSCTNWTAQLQAYLAYSSQAPASGTYTVRLDPAEPSNGPDGIGAGKISVSLAGQLSLSVKLGDGTSCSQSLKLCTQGRWPVYVSLYKGQGSIIGWVEFNRADSLGGDIGWTKPALPTSKYFSQGFTNVLDVQGASYIPRRTRSRPLNFTKGVVVFSGGGLEAPFTNTVNVSGSRLNAKTSPGLNFRINSKTGLFSGSAKLPDIRSWVKVSGTIFQADNEGFGYFLLDGQSGSVFFYGDYQ